MVQVRRNKTTAGEPPGAPGHKSTGLVLVNPKEGPKNKPPRLVPVNAQDEPQTNKNK